MLHIYDIATDIPVGRVCPIRLREAIVASSISTPVVDVSTEGGEERYGLVIGGTLKVMFASSLSPSEKTSLDGDAMNPAGGIIGAHDGRLGSEFALSSRFNYQILSLSNLNEVEYTQVRLLPGFYPGLRMWLESAGVSGVSVNAGVYSDTAGEPGTKLIEGSNSFTSADNGSEIMISFNSDYEITAATTVWIAVMTNSSASQFISTDTLSSPFHPIRFETRPSFTLPDTASPTAVAAGTALYAALLG